MMFLSMMVVTGLLGFCGGWMVCALVSTPGRDELEEEILFLQNISDIRAIVNKNNR